MARKNSLLPVVHVGLLLILIILTHYVFTHLHKINMLQREIQKKKQSLVFRKKAYKYLQKKRVVLKEIISRQKIIKTIESIRQLSFSEPPNFKKFDRTHLKDFITKEFERELPPEEITKTQKILYVFGFLPKEYDLQNTLINLYSEQIGAFYKVEDKALYTLPGLHLSGNIQKTMLSHELIHALQDQHYGIEQLSEKGKDNDDTMLAIQALLEGDATFSMQKFYIRTISFALLFDLFSLFFLDQKEFDKAPDVLKENLLFPYIKGMFFITNLYAKGGWELVNSAYTKYPESTEQILHPDKYLAGEKPVSVQLSTDCFKAPDYQLLEKNTLGEFNIALLLKIYFPDSMANQAAKGWGGDTYLIFENPEKNEFTLIWSTIWDTEEDARDFKNKSEQFFKRKHHNEKSPYVHIQIRDKQVDIYELPHKSLRKYLTNTDESINKNILD